MTATPEQVQAAAEDAKRAQAALKATVEDGARAAEKARERWNIERNAHIAGLPAAVKAGAITQADADKLRRHAER